MKRVVYILLLYLMMVIPTFAELKVSPTVIELSSKDVKNNYVTSSFNVQAGIDEFVRFKIYPEYFSITPDGKMEIVEKTNLSDSLVNNIKFVPSEFTLQNGRAQKVRLTINNFKTLPDGESRLVLFLEDVVPKELMLGNKMKNISTKLLVKTRIGIPVYFDNSKTIKRGNIETFSVHRENNNLICDTKIISSGNSKIRYQGKILLIKDKKLIDEYKIQKNVIGRENYNLAKNVFPVRNIQENGEYILKLVLNYKDENNKTKSLTKETRFLVSDVKNNI